MLVGLNSSHFSPPERCQLSAAPPHPAGGRAVPLNVLEEDWMWPGPLTSHTSPGTLLSWALPQVCTVLTQWTAACWSGGTPENVIAKSCVELVKEKQQFPHKNWKFTTRTGSYVQSTVPCWGGSVQLPGACCSDSCWCFPASLKSVLCWLLIHSVRNAAGHAELCGKDFCYTSTRNQSLELVSSLDQVCQIFYFAKTFQGVRCCTAGAKVLKIYHPC